MEFIKKAEEERLLHGEINGAEDSENQRLSLEQKRGPPQAGAKFRLHFLGPSEEPPTDAVFVLREDYGLIGFAHDPGLCTTALRRLLIEINGKDWGDDYVVTTMEGQYVPIGSTLGEQHVTPGTCLRLTRPAEFDPCRQS